MESENIQALLSTILGLDEMRGVFNIASKVHSSFQIGLTDFLDLVVLSKLIIELMVEIFPSDWQ